MLIGIIGAPNKGKSTLFSAITSIDVEIADRPFTTIEPNRGIAYVTKTCVEKELKTKCNPKNSACKNGTRFIPINVVDVAGLVPGASLGRGMGNKFMNDLIGADALIQIVDLSGETDLEGNHSEKCDPEAEVRMVRDELKKWIAGIIKRNISQERDAVEKLGDVFASLKIKREVIESAISNSNLPLTLTKWSDDEHQRFAEMVLELSKPIVIAANKLDKASPEALENLRKKLPSNHVIACSAAIELALAKAEKAKLIEYIPGSRDFEIIGSASSEQRKALDYMKEFIRKTGSGVQELLNRTAFEVLDQIVAYPVEDENKYTDHFGNVLPDAFLVKRGTTAMELAETVHTDLAKHMLYAVDAKKKLRVTKSYVLKDQDVVKIVSASR